MLGLVAVSSFTCSAAGVCTGLSPTSPVTGLFKQLQAELNRVRKIYGLPADVDVDGKIGTSTLAKLIKTAQAIDRALGERRDAALDDYVHTDIAVNLTPKMLATEADVVLAALKRNGLDPRYAPAPMQVAALIDPYLETVSQTGTRPPTATPGWFQVAVGPTGTRPPTAVAVGPTAPAGASATPSLPPPTSILRKAWIGVAIGAGVLTVGTIALVVAIARRG